MVFTDIYLTDKGGYEGVPKWSQRGEKEKNTQVEETQDWLCRMASAGTTLWYCMLHSARGR